MTTVSSTFSFSFIVSGIRPLRAVPRPAWYYRRRGTNAANWPLVHCQGHQPSTGGYGLRVMPAAPSREPSARRAWSIRPGRRVRASWAGARSLAARTWSGHRLFIIVAIPAVLLRVDAELGYRWQAWFNDSFEYVQNTVHFKLDPTRASGYSIFLKILQPFHSYALVTILQHLMGLAVAVMIYALATAPLPGPRLAGHAGRRAGALRRVRDPARAPDLVRRAAAVPARAGDHDAAVEPGGPVAADLRGSSACCSASPTASERSACRCSRSSPST